MAAAATTLKIDHDLKRRFDRLQAALRVMTGERITHTELLDRLLTHGEASPGTLVGKGWRPLTAKEREWVMSLPMDIGFEIGDVDEGLYGKRRKARP